ncbi:flagellar assembly protein FliH [Shewanella intestini]|uniref:Flagellar assembly protein FliH n=1 Tax=Shewanella intestini TaxID=2017544 RepID=A0ABS5I0D7_9GAMM|nr:MULTISPECIES: flagellar assembly protein FliH [Shewanella]MBR9726770.1 flagellar assembly protein FliH [Shewanella intestini]MRG34664.1 flagellar assembly protein FliH [Shewanella sp. XMDDZSB0408]
MTDDQDFSHWKLPDVTEEQDTSISNLFGRPNEPHVGDVSEDENIVPPTLAELEEMGLAAEKEGFEIGKKEGFAQGVETGRLEGLEQGHMEGFTQGEQQGFEAGQVRANEVLAQLNQLVSHFEQPLKILDTEVEHELLTIAMGLAKAVITQEIQTNPQHILSVLRQGISALPIKEQQVKILVNAANAELITTMYSENQIEKNNWQIDIDPTLGQGDCIIESLRSTVDLSLEQRMRQAFIELEANLGQNIHLNHEQKSASNYRTLDTGSVNASAQIDPVVQPTHHVDNVNVATSDSNIDAQSLEPTGITSSVNTSSSESNLVMEPQSITADAQSQSSQKAQLESQTQTNTAQTINESQAVDTGNEQSTQQPSQHQVEEKATNDNSQINDSVSTNPKEG